MNEKNLKYIATYTRLDGTVMHRVQVILKGKKRHNLGSYLNEDDAIKARNKFLIEKCGNLDRIKDYFKPTGKALELRTKALLSKGHAVKTIAETLGVSEMAVYRIKNDNTEDKLRTNDILKRLIHSNQYFKTM